MSAPKLQLAITERAADDLRSIQRYGLGQWGIEQAVEYEAAIHNAFETLCTHPEMGTTRDDLIPGLRSHPVLSHIVVYLIDGEMLVVQRIVHQRMDLRRAFLP